MLMVVGVCCLRLGSSCWLPLRLVLLEAPLVVPQREVPQDQRQLMPGLVVPQREAPQDQQLALFSLGLR